LHGCECRMWFDIGPRADRSEMLDCMGVIVGYGLTFNQERTEQQ